MQVPDRLLARNTVLNLIGGSLPLVVAAATMPFLIRGLGTERFGLLAIAWVVLGYFGALDLGLGRATTRFVADALDRGETGRVAALTWTAALMQAGMGLLGSVLVVVLTPSLLGVLDIPADLIGESETSFRIMAAAVPAVVVTAAFRGVLEAGQRFDLVNAIRIPFSLGNFLLPLVGVLLGQSLVGIMVLLVLARGAAFVVHFLVCGRIFPFLKKPARLGRQEARELLRFGGWVTVSTLIAPILVHLDRFAIGSLVSIAAVSFYAAPYEIVARLWIFPTSLAATLFPALSALSGRSEHGAIDGLVARSVKFVALVVGPLVILLVATARDVLSVWLGPDFARESTVALQILAIGVLVNSIGWVPYSVVQALGRPDLTAKLHLIEMPLHIVLVFTLIPKWGIAGAALAWSIRATLDTALLFAAAWRMSSLSRASLVRGRLPQVGAALLGFGAFAALVAFLVGEPWVRLPLLALGAAGMAWTIWSRLLDERDRWRITSLVRSAPVK